MKIAIQGQAADVEVIRELLSPWRISFSSLDEADVVLVYGEKPLGTKKTIVIPSDSGAFMKWVKDVKLRVLGKLGERVFVATGSQTVLTITPQMLYFYDGSVKLSSRNTSFVAFGSDENLVFLTLDIVKEFNKILDKTLNAKPSTLYTLLTGLPVPYTLAPKRLRDLIMRGHEEKENLTYCDKLPIDALRFILVEALEKLSNKKLCKKTWNGKKYACIMTHDIETSNGLLKAEGIKKLEQKYNVPSAWYIPSKHYRLNTEIIKELVNHGEIGAHGTRHDKELVKLPEQKLVKSLGEAKETLEKNINCSVDGFRAPLLQHSPSLLQGLREAGYSYDTSIPTWEPKHPRTMCPHGLGTTYPMFFDDLIEIPVSVTQDHQLLYVLGLEPKQAIAKWLSIMSVIKELGGVCVLLSHPEYRLFDKSEIGLYEKLLNEIVSDEQSWITTPKQLVDSVKRPRLPHKMRNLNHSKE